jgi:hypothetical protein
VQIQTTNAITGIADIDAGSHGPAAHGRSLIADLPLDFVDFANLRAIVDNGRLDKIRL